MYNLTGMIYANARKGGMNWNRPLWFLPCLFACTLLTLFIEKVFIHEKQSRRIASMIFSAFSGYVLASFYPGIFFPFQIETAINMMVWMELGLFLKNFTDFHTLEHRILQDKNSIMAASLLVVVGFLLAQLNPISVLGGLYGNYIMYLLNAIVIIAGIAIFSIWARNSNTLNYLGRHTLYVLLLHKFVILFFSRVFPFTKELMQQPGKFKGVLCCLIVTVISIESCLLLEKAIGLLKQKVSMGNISS